MLEKESFEQLEATNRLLLEMAKNQKINIRNIIRLFIVTIICYTVLLIFMVSGFFFYEAHCAKEDNDAISIEQEFNGDNSSVSNVRGNMYSGNATHNEEKIVSEE